MPFFCSVSSRSDTRLRRKASYVASGKNCVLTCEIVDQGQKEIIRKNTAISNESDYILSTHIVSKVLAMIAENAVMIAPSKSFLGLSVQRDCIGTSVQLYASTFGTDVSRGPKVCHGEAGHLPRLHSPYCSSRDGRCLS